MNMNMIQSLRLPQKFDRAENEFINGRSIAGNFDRSALSLNSKWRPHKIDMEMGIISYPLIATRTNGH
jgi:hypothetical protein